MNTVVDQLFESLPNSEFTDDVKAFVQDAWRPGRGFVESFAMMDDIVTRWSRIDLLDPLDPELKRLAAPLYSEAAHHALAIAAAVEQRSKQLENAGYRAGTRHRQFISVIHS